MLAVADDLGGAPDRRGDHFKTNHQDAQVQALMEAFQQHAAVELARCFDGLLHFLDRLQVHCNTLALLAIQRLDHDALVFVEKLQVVIGTARQLL